MPRKPKPAALTEVHARLFTEDVEWLKALAAERGTTYLIELRLAVRRQRKGETREVVMLKESPT